ncbi:hypothetical protein XM52_28010 [Roseovarius indicus]|jgi:hypothetical protein|uniref:Uncharacterized protein n=1 Tax=Roseovarius indicus TaxID=540747 RepID=A0A0T5NVN2_9RHOB|nr:hypothetical protein XM52_28010 [Roseovarius indicus]
MCVVAAQTFCCGQLAPEAAQAGKYLIRTSKATDSDPTVVLDQVDLITLLETKLSDELRGQTDGQRVTPFCDLHRDLPCGYTSCNVYPKGS